LKATWRGGEKLEGRVEPKEVLVVERNAVRKMKAFVFWFGGAWLECWKRT
jgi:hypothetical protein